MKKKTIVTTICIGSLFLSAGCGATLPELTEDQEEAIVEYAADVVMRYTRNYDSKLVDLSLYEEETQPEETQEAPPTEETSPQTPDTPVVDISEEEPEGDIAQVLLPEGVTLSFTGSRAVDTYPDGDSANPYFAMDASAGNKMLVLEFLLSNTTGETREIDLYSMAPRFTLLINDTEKVPVLATMLLDDLSTYMGSLEAGEEVKLVLIAEVDESLAESITALRLSVSAGGNSVVMPLQ